MQNALIFVGSIISIQSFLYLLCQVGLLFSLCVALASILKLNFAIFSRWSTEYTKRPRIINRGNLRTVQNGNHGITQNRWCPVCRHSTPTMSTPVRQSNKKKRMKAIFKKENGTTKISKLSSIIFHCWRTYSNFVGSNFRQIIF